MGDGNKSTTSCFCASLHMKMKLELSHHPNLLPQCFRNALNVLFLLKPSSSENWAHLGTPGDATDLRL